MPAPDITPETIQEIANAFRGARVLLTAYELGIFTAIGEGALPSEAVATAVGAHPRATDRLLNALVAMGFITKEDGAFRNGPTARECLVEGGPSYMAGLMHTAHLWHTWSYLTESVRTGRPFPRPPINDREERWRDAFIAAMHWRAERQARELVAQLDLNGVSRVLDVGGGSGAFSMEVLRRRPAAEAVVFDLPNVIPITQRYIVEAGFTNRITTYEGNYDTDELPGGFDLVLLSAIIHSNSPDGNRSLIRKCADALSAGGRVVVSDFIMDEDRTRPEHGALFALNMLVGTDEGDTYTESEIREWMTAAGLGDVVRKDYGGPASLMIGRKPQ